MSTFRRWQFLSLGIVFVAVASLTARSGNTVRASAAPGLATVTTGPIVGGVSDTGAVIFTRVSIRATVQFEYSTDPTFMGGVVATSAAQAVEAHDYTVQIPATGLQPLTTYYYRVLVDGVIKSLANQPHFTTFPPQGAPTDFSFVVVSDADNSRATGQPAPIFGNIGGLNPAPAFLMQIGDWDHRDPATQSTPPNIARWRRMHKDVLADDAAGVDFARYIAPNFPLFHIWDDHDYGADDEEEDADKDAPWKNLALQAFKEYFPLPPLANQEAGLWYTFHYGQAQFFVLDLRSMRDNGGLPDGPDKSMLAGDPIPNDQKTWLKHELSASSAKWKFIISTVAWNPTVQKLVDSWIAYTTERQELVDYIQQNGITGVIFISGDLHTGGAIDNGQYATFPEVSVPNTNLQFAWEGDLGCTSPSYCGDWSEGWYPGFQTNGYGLFTIANQPIDQVTLQTWAISPSGVLTKSLVVQLSTPVPSPTPLPTATSAPAGNPAPTSWPTPVTGQGVGSAGGTFICAPWYVVINTGNVPDGSTLHCGPFDPNVVPPAPSGLTFLRVPENVILYDSNGNRLTSFNPPLQMCYNYTDAERAAAGGDANNFVAITAEVGGTGWSELPTTVDTANRRVCGSTTHLTLFELSARTPTALPTTGGDLTPWIAAPLLSALIIVGAAVAFVVRRRMVR